MVFREPTFLLLGEEELFVPRDFEDPAGRGDQGQRGDVALTRFQNGGRQTDGLIGVPSDGAVLNLDVHGWAFCPLIAPISCHRPDDGRQPSGGSSPTSPSTLSRSKSAWPVWRPYSSIRSQTSRRRLG